MAFFVQYNTPTRNRCSAIVEDATTKTSTGRKITYLVKQELTPEEAATRDLSALTAKYGVTDGKHSTI